MSGGLRTLRAATGVPRATVVCFPHAGGNPTAYRAWPRRLPAEVTVLAANYPGRLDRLEEPPADSVFDMADEVASALDARPEPVGAQGLVFFGHSMGAYVAYETLLRVRRHPDLLAVSGTRTPHRMISRGVVQRGPDAVAADVMHLNDASTPVMQSPELRELVLPTIAADYWAVERYGRADKPHRVLDTPIRGYSGVDDAIGPPQEVALWMQLTRAPLGVREFTGAHFFLEDHRDAVVGDLLAQLPQVAPARSAAS